jgi:hypothetical protein
VVAARNIFEGWAKELRQDQLDEWSRGEISVTERVRALLDEHPLLVRSSRGLLLRWLRQLKGQEVLRWLKERRPDLQFREEPVLVRRIDSDLEGVRRLVEEY